MDFFVRFLLNYETMKQNGQKKAALGKADDYCLAEFSRVLGGLEPEQVKLLFRDLLTDSEALMLAKRLQIARALLAGKSYVQIQRVLGVTANTVAHVQKVLKSGGQGFRVAGKSLTVAGESGQTSQHRNLEDGSASANQGKKNSFGTVFQKIFHSPA